MIIAKNDDEEVLLETDKTDYKELISMEIIEENLKIQISMNNLEDKYKTDYFKMVNDKLNLISIQYRDNQEVLDEIENERNSFYYNSLELIQDKIGINFEFNTVLEPEMRYEAIYSLYRLFVLNLKETMTRTIINFFSKNIDELTKSYSINKKDVDFNILKKKYSVEIATKIYIMNDIIENIDYDLIEDFIEDYLYNNEDTIDDYFLNEIFIKNSVVELLSCDIDVLNNIIKTFTSNNSFIKNIENLLIK